MTTKLEIVNMALSNLGEKTIDSLENTSDRATKILLFYDPSIKRVLRGYFWNFATQNIRLETTTTSMPVPAKLQYVYKYPANVIRIKQLFNTDFKPGKKEIIYDGTNLLILSDTKEAIIKATIDISEAANFYNDLFVQAVGYFLASAAAVAVCGDKTKRDDNMAMFLKTIEVANSVDGNENIDDFFNNQEENV